MFLRCAPCTFVIGQEYEILICTKANGLISLEIDGRRYYPANSGVLDSEKSYAKIRVPQAALNKARSYQIVYRETVDRKAYFSEFGDEQRKTYTFRPLEKTDDIRIYHVADVHYQFSLAKKVTSYFGKDLDLLIVNGDIGEVETIENYYEVIEFVAEIAKGKIPVLFVRGNHDTRGHLAELFTEFFPANGKDTYYTFEVGPFAGVVYDCGEDKWDNHVHTDGRLAYNGCNAFELFRRRELSWLQNITLPKDKIPIAVGHIIPVQTTKNKGDIFDIERELYTQWNAEFERLGIKFMLCGHMHDAYILQPDDERNTLPHNYPVIVGSKMREAKNGVGVSYTDLLGTAITVKDKKAKVCFTDEKHEIREEYIIQL